MRIEPLWKALEADALAGKTGSSGWLLRLAHPLPTCPLFIALEQASRRRAVFLRLPAERVPVRRHWPRCRGLEAVAVRIEQETHFGVVLKEPRFADVFTALAEDLDRRVAVAGGAAEQATVFLGQLARWQKFLSASHDGLGEDEQRGLWGELHFLRAHLLPGLGAEAVAGWKGGEKAHQDYQFETGAAEVKTTLAKRPQVVRITSERQLDSSGWRALFLHVVALETREGGGETLPGLVAALRSALAEEASALEDFEDGLLAYGYLDLHAGRYSERGYLIRSETTFHVRRGFPRLEEKDLPTGVGEVNYGLSLAAVQRFAIETRTAVTRLCSP
jgi:Putative  PD-(D/E)XK family member, (DUF4420)